MLLETERLKLRLVTVNDDVSIADLLQEPEMATWMLNIPQPYILQNAQQFLNDVVDQKFAYAICLKPGMKMIGTIALLDRDKIDGERELGYWIGKKYWNHGYATDAISLICDLALSEMKLRALYAHVFEPNIASEKTLLKNNFRFVKMIPSPKPEKSEWMMKEFRRENPI